MKQFWLQRTGNGRIRLTFQFRIDWLHCVTGVYVRCVPSVCVSVHLFSYRIGPTKKKTQQKWLFIRRFNSKVRLTCDTRKSWKNWKSSLRIWYLWVFPLRAFSLLAFLISIVFFFRKMLLYAIKCLKSRRVLLRWKRSADSYWNV